MEDSRMTSSGIVGEVLTGTNYQKWKILIKTYLRSKNIWDIVDTVSTLTIIDAHRDAKALHIIQLSCGPHIFHQIKHFETAKSAWTHLAMLYDSELIAEPRIRPGTTCLDVSLNPYLKSVYLHITLIPNIYLCLNVNEIDAGLVSDNFSEHIDLYEFVVKGDLKGTSSYLRENSNAILRASSGKTVLHVATMKGHLKIVKKLVNFGKEPLVEMQDEKGYTALALACYSGDMDIAKCIMNGICRMKVVAIPNNNGEIPLLLAADSGHKNLTRFLFFKTPSDVLKHESSHHKVLLLERCIKAHIFGKQ